MLQEKACVITTENEWEVSEEIAESSNNPMYKGKAWAKYVSLTFAWKWDKIPLKISLTPEQAKWLSFGVTWRLRISFQRDV